MNLKINKNIKSLKKRSSFVEKITEETKELISEMIKVMIENDGIGLAAPQVNHFKRIILIQREEDILPLINPLIIAKSKEKDEMEEGCLSVSEKMVNIKRSIKIKVKSLDINGNEIVSDFKGLEARIFQHELDHLNGILIIDYIPLLEKIKNFFQKNNVSRLF